MKRALTVVIALLALSGEVDAESFSFTEAAGRIDIRFDGAPVATYVYDDPEIPRPYFCNVFAPNGVQITRRYPTDPVLNKDNDDHATYHPGIWLAFGDLGGEDFWRNDARVRHVRFVEQPSISGNAAKFVVENAYESSDEPPRVLCIERCAYTFHAEPSGYYLLVESVFTSKDGFAFGDQEEMGLGVRISTRFTVEHGSGTIRNTEGGVDEGGTWGRTAEWCSYYGVLDGERVGVSIMPSPDNFRRSWFHSRDYGLLVANPFGKKAMTGANDDTVLPSAVTVEAGNELKLGFGIRIFSEPAAAAFDSVSSYSKYRELQRGAKDE